MTIQIIKINKADMTTKNRNVKIENRISDNFDVTKRTEWGFTILSVDADLTMLNKFLKTVLKQYRVTEGFEIVEGFDYVLY